MNYPSPVIKFFNGKFLGYFPPNSNPYMSVFGNRNMPHCGEFFVHGAYIEFTTVCADAVSCQIYM